ncbi:hypothetical protein [Acidisoma cladoniae]|uniref:hypothetical protein n=1 Tax=Acidisoma cladoniae TaxID=3040935 RepID=UPI00254B770B|nr:hypothetical protein [Acidisoma sp. PAMC 29798]
MRHAFTLKLPPDHRVKGPDLVAVSLFGTDWCGDSVAESKAVAAAWDAPAPPADPALRPVWLHRTGRHSHEYRMEDILGEPYAVLWLTEAEFAGRLCHPPLQPGSGHPEQPPLPRWMQLGAAAASGVAEAPPGDLAHDVALRWTLRAHDPNAGLAPPAGWSESTHAGYQSIWSRDASGQVELESWAQGQAPNHIGGTMQPVQAHPEPGFSPFYVEFEEAMGGFNFGGGTAQLDLDQMRLDWACG